jgi:hypothetical protein
MKLVYSRLNKGRRIYDDKAFLKSIEVCCPDMSFNLDKETNEWRIAVGNPFSDDFPYCGAKTIVYYDGKLCSTSEEWEGCYHE